MGHGNLVCIVPIVHGPREVEGEFPKSRKSAAAMKRARGKEEDADRTSGTYEEGKLAACSSLEESFLTFLLSSSRRAGRSAERAPGA